VFPKIEGMWLISTHEGLKEMKGGATCFVTMAQTENKSTKE